MTTQNPDEIIIKHEDLNKVMNDCHQHIAKLLEKSTKYTNERDYPISIAICIIALEEIGKFEIFGDYQRELKDVPKSEMKKLLGHKYKLTQFLENERVREIRILKKEGKINEINEINKSVEYQKTQFKSLNIVKQLGLYYNYDKGNTITLETHFMKNSITENNLGHFCIVLHELVYFRFNLAVLRSQCGTIDGVIDQNSEHVKRNKNYHHITEYTEKVKTEKYKASLQKFQNTMLELEKLISYLNP